MTNAPLLGALHSTLQTLDSLVRLCVTLAIIPSILNFVGFALEWSLTLSWCFAVLAAALVGLAGGLALARCGVRCALQEGSPDD